MNRALYAIREITRETSEEIAHRIRKMNQASEKTLIALCEASISSIALKRELRALQ